MKIFSRETLKIIAMVAMLIDHTYHHIAPDMPILNQIGRIAFPIFAYGIVEGFYKTHDRGKQLTTLFLFALVSEIPFNYYISEGGLIFPLYQNVMFNFFFGLVAINLMEKVIHNPVGKQGKSFGNGILVAMVAFAFMFVADLTLTDYGDGGVLTVLLFYTTYKIVNPYNRFIINLVGMYYINFHMLYSSSMDFFGLEIPTQGLAVFALIPISLYSGKKSLSGTADKAFKYFGYIFYPAHLLILGFIYTIIR